MKNLFLIIILLATTATQSILAADDPVADPAAVVTSGRARFTVLTNRMIRIQYSATSRFEDRATFAVVNRKLPVPQFTTREADGYLYIETDALTLRYKVGSTISASLKSPNNLCITMPLNGRIVTWYPGKEDALNLKGTKRTLDTASGDNQRPDLEDGILSRAGWALLDESPKAKRGDGSRSFAFDRSVDGIPWVAQPVDANALDYYFLGYGHDYKGALADYVKVAGRQPMPPLYALGYWYSKYQRYSQQDFVNLVTEIHQNDIPLDVMIFDMDWHLDGWTGWTWNSTCIPPTVWQAMRTTSRRFVPTWASPPTVCLGCSKTPRSIAHCSDTSSVNVRNRASTSGGSTGSKTSRAIISTDSAKPSGATTCSITTCG